MPGAPPVPVGHNAIPQPSNATFYKPQAWLPPEMDEETTEWEYVDEAPKWSGHENNPRLLPLQVFSLIAGGICTIWLCASLVHLLSVCHVWTGVWKVNHQDGSSSLQAVGPELGVRLTVEPAALMPYNRALAMMAYSNQLSFQRGEPLHGLESVTTIWPHPNLLPVSISCDVAGRRLALTDGFFLFSAELKDTAGGQQRWWQRSRASLAAEFGEIPCPSLVGEGLQDASVSCYTHGAGGGQGSIACDALVLHRRGRRISTCLLAGPEDDASAATVNISDSWLERQRSRTDEEEAPSCETGPHRCVEKAVAIARDPACPSGSGVAPRCAVLATTQGRVVRLRQRNDRSDELVPAEVLREGSSHGVSLAMARAASAPVVEPLLSASLLGPGSLRPLIGPYFGLLQGSKGGQSIAVLDSASSGAEVGRMQLPPDKPVVSFCIGGGSIFLLGEGPNPKIWRMPLPIDILPNV